MGIDYKDDWVTNLYNVIKMYEVRENKMKSL